MTKKKFKKIKQKAPIMNHIKFNEVSDVKYADFIDICRMTQDELKGFLLEVLKLAKYKALSGDGWVYAKGEIPILLTAHMDTVHKVQMYEYMEYTDAKGNHILTSQDGIGGDDRCGIYMILEIIKNGFRPSILFCEDEEIGGVGSDKFIKTEEAKQLEKLNYMIELDRANSDDAVFYDCDNKDFTKYITEFTGYKKTYGSFSDISNLAPFAGIAAVNLSCGYYNAHTTSEKVNMEEMFNTINIVSKLLEDETGKKVQFEYIPDACSLSNYYYGYDSSYHGEWFAPDDYIVELDVMYVDKNGRQEEEIIEGYSEADAWTNFFMIHGDICFNDVIDYYVCRI